MGTFNDPCIWEFFLDGKLILMLKILIDFFDGLLGRSINAALFFGKTMTLNAGFF